MNPSLARNVVSVDALEPRRLQSGTTTGRKKARNAVSLVRRRNDGIMNVQPIGAQDEELAALGTGRPGSIAGSQPRCSSLLMSGASTTVTWRIQIANNVVTVTIAATSMARGAARSDGMRVATNAAAYTPRIGTSGRW